MEMRRHTAAILGAGGWGTTLALLLHRKGHRVRLWAYEETEVENIRQQGENVRFLPGVKVPPEIEVSTRLPQIVQNATLMVMATPAQHVRQVAQQLAACVPSPCPVLNVSKGIEIGTLRRMSQVLTEELPPFFHPLVATLSGPSHAEEVSRHLPTLVVVAAQNVRTSGLLQQVFMSDTFRVYTSEDLVGVELAGSLKNVIAIAAGVCDGLGFGDNSKSALLTRGLAEISRLGLALGSKPVTFAGLAGMGDLITTCMSRHSRNRFVGEQIGRGLTLSQVLEKMVMVAEGVATTRSAWQLAKDTGVEMPIVNAVFEVLFEERNPAEAVQQLMLRPPKPEVYW